MIYSIYLKYYTYNIDLYYIYLYIAYTIYMRRQVMIPFEFVLLIIFKAKSDLCSFNNTNKWHSLLPYCIKIYWIILIISNKWHSLLSYCNIEHLQGITRIILQKKHLWNTTDKLKELVRKNKILKYILFTIYFLTERLANVIYGLILQ